MPGSIGAVRSVLLVWVVNSRFGGRFLLRILCHRVGYAGVLRPCGRLPGIYEIEGPFQVVGGVDQVPFV